MGTDLISSDTRPIKATRTALNIIKANKKLIENSKTGNVTAVVPVMKIFDKNIVNSPNASSRKLSIKPNKKQLNSAKLHQTGLKEPVNNVNEGLIVKKKTIRVLLDTGSSGNLLFTRKGSQKYIPCVKRAAPQLWGTSNGTFLTKKVGEINSLFWSTPLASQYT
jgi:hypothetical protein